MGYMVLGPKAIYLVSIVIFIFFFGILQIFINFAAQLLIAMIFKLLTQSAFLTEQNKDLSTIAQNPFYFKILLFAMLLPFIFRKDLRDLKSISSWIQALLVLNFFCFLMMLIFYQVDNDFGIYQKHFWLPHDHDK